MAKSTSKKSSAKKIAEEKPKTVSNTRNFALRVDGREEGVFTGKSPRQAALKVANKGYTDFGLREKGTKRVHLFRGERNQVKRPDNAPSWMPAKVWKPNVEKIGVEHLESIHD
jgi:hypothetical protein